MKILVGAYHNFGPREFSKFEDATAHLRGVGCFDRLPHVGVGSRDPLKRLYKKFGPRLNVANGSGGGTVQVTVQP